MGSVGSPLLPEDAGILTDGKFTDDPGSRITKKVKAAANIVKSVSYTRDIAVLKVYASGVGARPGILSGITESLSSSGINIKSVVTSQTCISLLLSTKDIQKGRESIQKIRPLPFRESSVLTDVALISIVGEDLQTNRGVAAKCFTAVSDADVNIEMISFGTSTAALYFLVREEKLDDTLKAFHHIFFN